MATIIKGASAWADRASWRRTYTNASLANATNRDLMAGQTSFFSYLGGFTVRALTACKVTIKSGTTTVFMELNLPLDTDVRIDFGMFPLKGGAVSNNWMIAHDQAVAVTLITTAWGRIGD